MVSPFGTILTFILGQLILEFFLRRIWRKYTIILDKTFQIWHLCLFFFENLPAA